MSEDDFTPEDGRGLDLPPLGEAAGEVPMQPKTDVRDFAAFLTEHRRGGCVYDLGVALQRLVTAVEDTGKGGSLTLTLKLKPDAKYGTAVEVADGIVVKVPEPSRPSSLFFMDGSHNLVRHDPAAMQIPFPNAGDDDDD